MKGAPTRRRPRISRCTAVSKSRSFMSRQSTSTAHRFPPGFMALPLTTSRAACLARETPKGAHCGWEASVVACKAWYSDANDVPDAGRSPAQRRSSVCICSSSSATWLRVAHSTSTGSGANLTASPRASSSCPGPLACCRARRSSCASWASVMWCARVPYNSSIRPFSGGRRVVRPFRSTTLHSVASCRSLVTNVRRLHLRGSSYRATARARNRIASCASRCSTSGANKIIPTSPRQDPGSLSGVEL
mmetsp:Transcript_18033/g.50870  ORF Transcript_18033/g.50870 Transcript_18033/m.50870 type:complete len:247 (-) Transcript_18033:1001-1741(-)